MEKFKAFFATPLGVLTIIVLVIVLIFVLYGAYRTSQNNKFLKAAASMTDDVSASVGSIRTVYPAFANNAALAAIDTKASRVLTQVDDKDVPAVKQRLKDLYTAYHDFITQNETALTADPDFDVEEAKETAADLKELYNFN
jgi:C4-dicarboxylate-specific signal transduction histidine kinase